MFSRFFIERPIFAAVVSIILVLAGLLAMLALLVMGAYGHSRIRDFILGGATKSIVANPPLPVLLSH